MCSRLFGTAQGWRGRCLGPGAVLSPVLLRPGARVACLAWPWLFARGEGGLDLWTLRMLSWIGRCDDLDGGAGRRGAEGDCGPALEYAAFYAPPVYCAVGPDAGAFVTALVGHWFLTLP